MATSTPTPVVFRRYKDTLAVVALLPTICPAYGLCQAYSAGGQASVVDYFQTLRDTMPASALTQQSVRHLLLELATRPERYQLQAVAAEAVHVAREAAGEQMSLFALAAPVAASYAR